MVPTTVSCAQRVCLAKMPVTVSLWSICLSTCASYNKYCIYDSIVLSLSLSRMDGGGRYLPVDHPETSYDAECADEGDNRNCYGVLYLCLTRAQIVRYYMHVFRGFCMHCKGRRRRGRSAHTHTHTSPDVSWATANRCFTASRSVQQPLHRIS